MTATKAPPRAPRTLKLTSPPMHGSDVELLQQTINAQLVTWRVPHKIAVDGVYGSATRDALQTVLYGLGIAQASVEHGVTGATRSKLRHKWLTKDEQRRYAERAAWRRQLVARYAGHGPAAAISFAHAQLGTMEHPAGSNTGPKIDAWQAACGVHAAPWCGCFVNACLVAAGFPSEEWLRYCPSIEASAKAGVGGWSWHSLSEARNGDLITYGAAIAVHVGLVVVAADHVTIEGNTSAGAAGSQDNGGMVALRRRDWHAAGFPARGIARPPYSKH
jgi:hypothetical protein